LKGSPVTANFTVEIFIECVMAEDRALPYRQFQGKGNAKMMHFFSHWFCIRKFSCGGTDQSKHTPTTS